jgi:hypothetical protein
MFGVQHSLYIDYLQVVLIQMTVANQNILKQTSLLSNPNGDMRNSKIVFCHILDAWLLD